MVPSSRDTRRLRRLLLAPARSDILTRESLASRLEERLDQRFERNSTPDDDQQVSVVELPVETGY
jgi:hypothetical protein